MFHAADSGCRGLLRSIIACLALAAFQLTIGHAAPASGARHALIVIGLPGDAEHRRQFDQVAAGWIRWLTSELQYPVDQIVVLYGRQSDEASNRRPATRESLEETAGALCEQLGKQDSLWVFFLGHANYDEEHAFFHLPGPDLHEEDLAELFAELKCNEQIFWMTHTCSGWFLKPLSREGRIVITATAADREVNETEFPRAMLDVTRTPAEELDGNGDQRVSLAEFFVRTVAEVGSRFAADMRAATEHAQLDDNGDGAGTEVDKLVAEQPPEEATSKPPPPVIGRAKLPDGKLAANTFLPTKPTADRTVSDESETTNPGNMQEPP